MSLPLLPIDVTPLRAVLGELPLDGATEVAGVKVPPGHRLPIPAGNGEPAVWVTTELLQQPRSVVADLHAAFPQSGLWPWLTYGPADRPSMEGFEQWADVAEYPWGANAESWRFGADTSSWTTETVWRDLWHNSFSTMDLEDEEPDSMWRHLHGWPGLTTPATPGREAEVRELGGRRHVE